MDRTTATAIRQVVSAVVVDGARRAAKYLAPSLVVRATRPQYRRGNDKRAGTIILTIGAPNYAHRQFIKACKKAGEPFPVKKVQVKMPRARRK